MSYLSEVLADSPLGVWLLDEASGTTAADSSGNGRHMSINGSVTLGAATVMPTGTSSFDFAGTGTTYLQAAAAAWMAVSSFTVTAWVRLDSTSSYRAIMSRENTSGTNRQWSFYSTSGKLNVFTSSDRLGTGTLSTSTVYFVAATYDSATSTLKYYINGSLDATLTSITIPNNQTATPYDLVVGASHAGGGGYSFLFDGRMGPVAYFGSVLSPTRLAAHYTAGTTASGDATVTVPVATATADALVPVVSTTATVDVPVATATAAALVPTVAATGDATVLVPTATATATALAPGLAFDAGTDTSNALGGRERDGVAQVEVIVPVASPPAAISTTRVDKAIPLPEPVLVKGRPT